MVPKKLQVQVQDLQFRLTFNALLFSLYSIHLQIIFSLINVVSQVLQNFYVLWLYIFQENARRSEVEALKFYEYSISKTKDFIFKQFCYILILFEVSFAYIFLQEILMLKSYLLPYSIFQFLGFNRLREIEQKCKLGQ